MRIVLASFVALFAFYSNCFSAVQPLEENLLPGAPVQDLQNPGRDEVIVILDEGSYYFVVQRGEGLNQDWPITIEASFSRDLEEQVYDYPYLYESLSFGVPSWRFSSKFSVARFHAPEVVEELRELLIRNDKHSDLINPPALFQEHPAPITLSSSQRSPRELYWSQAYMYAGAGLAFTGAFYFTNLYLTQGNLLTSVLAAMPGAALSGSLGFSLPYLASKFLLGDRLLGSEGSRRYRLVEWAVTSATCVGALVVLSHM